MKLTTLAFVLAAATSSCRNGSPSPEATVSPDMLRVRVRVVHPTVSEVGASTPIVGTLRPWRRAILSARVAGDVTALSVERGDRVTKGKLLGELRVPGLPQQVASAIANEEVAEAMLVEQKDVADRMKGVAAANSSAVSSLEVSGANAKASTAAARLQAAKADATKASAMLSDARILAPFDGVIVARLVDPGTSVGPGDKLIEVAEVATLRLVVDVPERDTGLVSPDAPVVVTVPSLGDRKIDAKISRFAPALDAATRTLRIEIDVANDGTLFAGAEARVRFAARAGKVLTIPDDALVVGAGGTFAFIAKDGKAKRVPIKTGVDDGARVEVRQGLSAEDDVIVGGGGLLDDGAPVEIAR